MKCKHNPCQIHNDDRCCKKCSNGDCEFICGYWQDKSCKWEVEDEVNNTP